MVGSVVHCAECGKPFHVEQGSEVMQVARPAQWPLRPRFRLRRWFHGCMWIIAGLVVLAFLLMLFFGIFYLFRATPVTMPSRPPAPVKTGGPTIRPLDCWGQLHGLPPGATLFGAIDFMPAGNLLTLDDERTQTLLRLFLPKETANRITSENLGRIQLNGIGLACYNSAKGEDALALVHLNGTALDGRKRIADYAAEPPKPRL